MARRGYAQLVNGFHDNDKVRDLVRMGHADPVGIFRTALPLCGDRLTDGFISRRANMSGIPPSKRHRHTWQCEHVLQALGRDKETATPDQRACQMAKQPNKEKS